MVRRFMSYVQMVSIIYQVFWYDQLNSLGFMYVPTRRRELLSSTLASQRRFWGSFNKGADTFFTHGKKYLGWL